MTPPGSVVRRRAGAKDVIVQIRVPPAIKVILDQAAAQRGQNLSEFALDSARRRAEETILDQRTFFLDATAHARFLALLDRPTRANKRRLARLNRNPSWE